MRIVIFITCLLLAISCHEGDNKNNLQDGTPADTTQLNDNNVQVDISHVKKGWDMDKVIKKVGEPQTKEVLGQSTDAKGNVTSLENWYYNHGNQQISFVNGEVSGISLDVKAADDAVNAKIDSALKAEGNHGGIIQPGK